MSQGIGPFSSYLPPYQPPSAPTSVKVATRESPGRVSSHIWNKLLLGFDQDIQDTFLECLVPGIALGLHR